MAFVTLNTKKLKENFSTLDRRFKNKGIKWSVVTKMLCGHRQYLDQIISLGVTQICDSRIANLKVIKTLAPEIETVFIKPPAKRNVQNIIRYADISFNTEFEIIRRLSDAAVSEGKVHKVVIMLELGELREGVMGDRVVDLYSKVIQLPSIEVVGIGTNLTCMYGILPNPDKLVQLRLYKQLLEAKFGTTIRYLSGGTSVTVPLMEKGILPDGINHFRIGETLFLGTNVYDGTDYQHMHQDVFKLHAEILELAEKPQIPTGELGLNLCGDTATFDDSLSGLTSFRALIDIGLLDVEDGHIKPADSSIIIAGASSDMIVVDLGENLQKLRVGDTIEFSMDYMGLLRLMNSPYVEKRLEPEELFAAKLSRGSIPVVSAN